VCGSSSKHRARAEQWGGLMMDAAYPIGFIGLGTMGEVMALTLVKAGTVGFCDRRGSDECTI
jgi:hypothetical protein